MQWGRLQVDVNCALRRGAWYRVTRLAPLVAVLDVNRQFLPVPNYLVQVVSQPPRRWSVVPRPERAALRGRPRHLTCARCRGEFEVAWDEEYLLKF